jgi:hypothetical protein
MAGKKEGQMKKILTGFNLAALPLGSTTLGNGTVNNLVGTRMHFAGGDVLHWLMSLVWFAISICVLIILILLTKKMIEHDHKCWMEKEIKRHKK